MGPLGDRVHGSEAGQSCGLPQIRTPTGQHACMHALTRDRDYPLQLLQTPLARCCLRFAGAWYPRLSPASGASQSSLLWTGTGHREEILAPLCRSGNGSPIKEYAVVLCAPSVHARCALLPTLSCIGLRLDCRLCSLEESRFCPLQGIISGSATLACRNAP